MKSFKTQFPAYSDFFDFEEFNKVQLQCYNQVVSDTRNMIISAPTSSGKTVLFQLAIIKALSTGKLRCLYLAPIKALCHEKLRNWQKKFKNKIKIIQITGDSIQNDDQSLQDVEITVATPEKIDYFSRKNLSYLSQIQLLLVDEIHMLNFQERGATLQAIISRIMSLNNPRIIAVSATIPNISEVGEWLKVPSSLVKMFGEEYRPVPINKVVLGFKSTNNPFTFEKVLNYKLLQVIRNYSEGGGSLVFCQTQKGTQAACHQLISDMGPAQFIKSDSNLIALNKGASTISNPVLKSLLPQGIAFHNAGLTLQDRITVQKLFLAFHIKILCTTSTLAMGMNLPARLVVLKSTQTYRGSGKGYQQYSQIQIDQMMGRAGRIPFDDKGTVVIMTQKKQYNKYLNMGRPETLQSHLYEQLSEHINAQISLKSLSTEDDVYKYFQNSFCYIRMKKCPQLYNISNNFDEDIKRICSETIKKLSSYGFITFSDSNKKIIPRYLGIAVAKNSINIDTLINIMNVCKSVTNQRQFINAICEGEEVKKIRNKLDQRKLLKELNEKVKYPLKNAVSTSQKKCYVLLQTQLDGRYIQNWQMRKQSKDFLQFFRRLLYCLKIAMNEMNLFWSYYWSCLYLKYVSLKFWTRNQQAKAKIFPEIAQKWKTLTLHGIKTIQQIYSNFSNTNFHQNSTYNQGVLKKLQNLKYCVTINYEKSDKKGIVKIKLIGQLDQTLKSALVIIGDNKNQVVCSRVLQNQNEQLTLSLPFRKHYIGILKDGYIGFDEFYTVSESGSLIPYIPEESKNNIKTLKHEDYAYKSEQKFDAKRYSNEIKSKQKQIKPKKKRQTLKIVSESKQKKSEQGQKKVKLRNLNSIKNDEFKPKRFEKSKNKFVQIQNGWKSGFPEIIKSNNKAVDKKIQIYESSQSLDKQSIRKVESVQKKKDSKIQDYEDPYDYFYNLF